jgi:hypothetical protein
MDVRAARIANSNLDTHHFIASREMKINISKSIKMAAADICSSQEHADSSSRQLRGANITPHRHQDIAKEQIIAFVMALLGYIRGSTADPR